MLPTNTHSHYLCLSSSDHDVCIDRPVWSKIFWTLWTKLKLSYTCSKAHRRKQGSKEAKEMEDPLGLLTYSILFPLCLLSMLCYMFFADSWQQLSEKHKQINYVIRYLKLNQALACTHRDTCTCTQRHTDTRLFLRFLTCKCFQCVHILRVIRLGLTIGFWRIWCQPAVHNGLFVSLSHEQHCVTIIVTLGSNCKACFHTKHSLWGLLLAEPCHRNSFAAL